MILVMQNDIDTGSNVQNNIGAVTDGGPNNVVFQAGNNGIISMALGTTPQHPGEACFPICA